MNPDRKKMLVTGVSGMLGSNLAWYFRDLYAVTGFYHQNKVGFNNIVTIQCNLCESERLRDMLERVNPDVIVHCAGLVDVDRCQQDRELADSVNIHATRNLVEAIPNPATRFIYISSDSVYDGVQGNFSEDDPVAPQNYYGVTKYQGELVTLTAHNALVLRTNIFGWNITAKEGLAEWILSSLKGGQRIKGFADAIFSTIYTVELGKIIGEAAAENLSGIYNCGSADSCSKYQFAMNLAAKFGLNEKLIEAGSLDDCIFIAPRGKNLSMDSGKIQKRLGLCVPGVQASIRSLYRDAPIFSKKPGLRDRL